MLLLRMYINEVLLCGRMGADPIFKVNPRENPYVIFVLLYLILG